MKENNKENKGNNQISESHFSSNAFLNQLRHRTATASNLTTTTTTTTSEVNNSDAADTLPPL